MRLSEAWGTWGSLFSATKLAPLRGLGKALRNENIPKEASEKPYVCSSLNVIPIITSRFGEA
ncbi:MAG: hypothetical protein ACK4GN_07345 [Runella sp.]